MKKHIFTDIDGTIYDHGHIPPSTITALQKAKANGHNIYICTGRTIGQLPEELDSIIEFDGKICSSGSYIELGKSIYLDYFFPEDMQKEMVDIIRNFDVMFTLETNTTIHYSHMTEEAVLIFPGMATDLAGKSLIPRYKLFDEKDPYPETNKICVFHKDNPAILIELRKLLKNQRIFLTKEMQLKYSWYFEISPRNVSKGSAIKYLVNNHQIPYTDTVAIGDSMNDDEMVKYAEIGIAMGNGDIRLKKLADYVTDDILDDGYYKAFKHFNII